MYVSDLCNPVRFSGNSLLHSSLIIAKAPSSQNRHHKPPLASSFLLFNVNNNDTECYQMHLCAQLCHFFPSPLLFYGKNEI